MPKPRPGLTWWAACLFLALLAWGGPGWPQPVETIRRLPHSGETATSGLVAVPDLLRKTLPQARTMVGQQGLRVQEMGTRPSPQPPGTIVAQNPPPGERVRRGTVVRVWLAEPVRPRKVAVPNLRGRTPSEAESLLGGRGLKLGQETPIRGGGQPGTIVRQQPTAGELVFPGTAVAVWVAGDDRVTVPLLVGRQENPAREELYRVQLNVGRVNRIYHSRPAGEVLSQKPGPGTRVPRQSRVDLEVSLGPQPAEDVRVPPVVTLSLNRARERIVAHNLRVGDLRRERHREPAGVVFQQKPAPGTPVSRGSPVHLWVSLGPQEEAQERVQVPNLFGLTPQEAGPRLGNLGLALGERGWEESARHPEGTVIRQDPEPGAWRNRGSRVRVWLARRPPSPTSPSPPQPGREDWRPPSGGERDTVRVPDLRGQEVARANALLREHRLRPGGLRQEYCLRGAGLILRQEPPAGREVRVGSPVHLYVGQALPAGYLVGGGALASLLGLAGYHFLKKGFRPRPAAVTARPGGLEDMQAAMEWPDGEPRTLELRLRACADPGTQDLEAPGPLVRGERREHE